ncbi:ArsR/SmtB family transcription factor [Paenibacillus dendritiformis]|uniref:ArsR/SmtB family transcription factor n=1 Tax=Paenibacillus dendritiformis TaxID=130049 RepID=UPI000DAA83C8|nr:helix-turn-helix domain-containing protein [Paenibacillus dendritiformis]PZM66185.1 transcriptional regulator [Paenibacillus dendritiformis]
MRNLYHPPAEEIQLTAVLYALSDPIRLEMIRFIDQYGETRCGDMGTAIPKSTMSHHFKVLRESGVTRTRISGTQRFMSLRKEELEDRFPGLLQSVLSAYGKGKDEA